jgi:hypothetical protein
LSATGTVLGMATRRCGRRCPAGRATIDATSRQELPGTIARMRASRLLALQMLLH